VTPRAGAALVPLAVLGAFATAFGATFQFDDAHAVVDNPQVHSWSAWAESLPAIRALSKASFVASRTLADAPWSFVLISVLLHAAAAVAALHLTRRWLPALGVAPSRAQDAALAAALVFALHPAQTEAVTYVSGRSVVLAGALSLCALAAHEHWREDRARRGALAVSLSTFALALAARETAWTLPFAIVLLAIARGARWRAAWGEALLHFAVLGGAVCAIAASPTYRRLLRESLATRGPLANLYAQIEGIAYLVTHPLATLRVNFDPDVRVPATPDGGWALAALAIALTLGVGMRQLRRRPWLGVGIVWFFLQLAPTNGVVARYDLVNDRQLYLALLGPALCAGVALSHARMHALATATVVTLLAAATLVRNLDYASELALWQATVRASPQKSRPWNNLGWALLQEGRRDDARAAFERALALDPSNFRARANLEALR
jgi:tetratricopeptide (TPR) repeat protein